MLISIETKSQNCTCFQSRDSSFHPVPFAMDSDGYYAPSPPLYRNDDGSTGPIKLPFTFCYCGKNIDTVYINNNGNISFHQQYSTYSSDTFPVTNYSMIAPFWGDVDTRNTLSGIVWYKITATHLIVQWDSVGYFNKHSDKLNSFQVIISNGTDSIIPAGNNVEFCYGNMQWTTGDASYDTNGFGGVPATSGINRGNDSDFIQFGLFDTAGSQYRGQYPGWPYNGVGWLSNKMFYYNTCYLPLPPMISGITPCDTIIVCSNDSTFMHLLFFTPKQNDTVVGNQQSTLPAGLSITSNKQGSIDSITLKVIGPLSTLGYHTVQFYGNNKNNSKDTGFASFVLNVTSSCISTSVPIAKSEQTVELYPNPNNGIFTLSVNLNASNSENSLTIQVFDITGKKVLTEPISQLNGDNAIDMKGKPKGIYLYRLINTNETLISQGKFVIGK